MTAPDDPAAASPSASEPLGQATAGAPCVEDLDAPQTIAAEVSAEIERFLAEKADEFVAISPDAAAIGQALVDFTRGGKRIRPVLMWWGFQLAGGRSGSDDRSGSDGRSGSDSATRGLAQAAGSLELLHAAALIHDDVIDHSDTRRGRPSLHRQFEAQHADNRFQGEGDSFGVSASIVVGDICLALSEELFERSQAALGITPAARELRATIRRDVMVGQYLDVLAEVIPLDDVRISDRAWEVLSYKSAKYSVEQPLLLGAGLAGASQEQLGEISDFGLPLGQAFQLRDDVLGIVGDPDATGKPAGDDIREGKRTVLIAETVAALSPERTEVLARRLGDPSLTDAEVAECVDMITAAGGLSAVESFIDDKHARAQTVLRVWAEESNTTTCIGPAARDRLATFATALSYRTS